MGIRIQPRDLEVPQDEPFLHDRLDREAPARVLTRIVSSVEGPCVLSIDGPFGSGKSTFLRLWTQHLKNKGFPVVRLNAWETDYSGDPFPALVDGIGAELESPDGGDIEIGLKALRKTAGRVAMRVIPALIRQATVGLIDVGPEELGNAFGTVSEEAARDGIAQFQAQRKSLTAFREELCEFSEALSAAHDDRPLVIAIDELDRCRPSYAIEMLELAKHLFAVDHVVFALAVNRSELAHSVKVLYGQDFDADRYLRRFFDLDFRLPQPDRTAFIEQLMEATELNDHLERQGLRPMIEQLRPQFDAILQAFLTKDPFTLRDIAQAIHHQCRDFTTGESARRHRADRAFIERELENAEHAGDRVVVITHHAPSPRSIRPWFKGDPYNCAFASDLDRVIERYQPELWIHGHMHDPVDERLGRTRLLANPAGYRYEAKRGFDPGLCANLGETLPCEE